MEDPTVSGNTVSQCRGGRPFPARFARPAAVPSELPERTTERCLPTPVQNNETYEELYVTFLAMGLDDVVRDLLFEVAGAFASKGVWLAAELLHPIGSQLDGP